MEPLIEFQVQRFLSYFVLVEKEMCIFAIITIMVDIVHIDFKKTSKLDIDSYNA